MQKYSIVIVLISFCITIQGFRLYGGPGDMYQKSSPYTGNRRIKSADSIRFNPFIQSQQDYMHQLVSYLADIGKR